MEAIKAIIIDDEHHCRATLEYEIKRHCPQVSVIAAFSSAIDALEQVPRIQPELIFLDIEMPHMNGFEFLKQAKGNFGVIFTTAYDQFALRAFQNSAIDYLLKPISADDLLKAIEKYEQQNRSSLTADQLEILFGKLEGKSFSKVALPTQEGLEFVHPQDICHCESSSNYTYIYFRNRQKMVISKTLKEVEEMLDGKGFFRVHHSHLINLNDVKKYVKGNGGYVVMDNEVQVPVSRSRKDALMDLFKGGISA